ncbi:hypothetical protein P9597_28410 [Aneurinibacillus migulanus]|uniref:hypothetical protein n=1 Tax=Aneurinibacillus migulanus TaxID=47500 RepID=UPI002E1E62E5|nr:hypothetical protein [Aneurinibacillus migulanus]
MREAFGSLGLEVNETKIFKQENLEQDRVTEIHNELAMCIDLYFKEMKKKYVATVYTMKDKDLLKDLYDSITTIKDYSRLVRETFINSIGLYQREQALHNKKCFFCKRIKQKDLWDYLEIPSDYELKILYFTQLYFTFRNATRLATLVEILPFRN